MTDYSSSQGRLNHNSILVQDTHRVHVNHYYLDIGVSLFSSESSSLYPRTAQTGVKSMAGKFLHFLTFLNLILGSSKTQSRHIPSLYQLRPTPFGVHPSPSVAILVRLFDSAQNILCQLLSSQALMSGPPVSSPLSHLSHAPLPSNCRCWWTEVYSPSMLMPGRTIFIKPELKSGWYGESSK